MTIRVWDASTGVDTAEILQPLRGHNDKVWSVAFSPDGSKIVSGSGDTTIRVWDASTGVGMPPRLRGHISRVYSVAFSPNGSRIVSGSGDNTIRVWDATASVEMLPPLRSHDECIVSVVFSPDGSQIISRSEDENIQVWDAGTGVELPRAQTAVDHISRSALDGPIVSLKGEWFRNINTGSYLGRLPVGASFYFWRVYRSTYIGWTRNDKLVIIQFPVL
jgi:WD40 repeat protein